MVHEEIQETYLSTKRLQEAYTSLEIPKLC
jgi:hypothetical protein